MRIGFVCVEGILSLICKVTELGTGNTMIFLAFVLLISLHYEIID